MAYSTTYTDERGSSVPVSISDEESREAIRNDWNVLRGMFNPRYVTVEEAACESGEEFRFRITVHAPSHYLTDRDDASPKSCSSMSATEASSPPSTPPVPSTSTTTACSAVPASP